MHIEVKLRIFDLEIVYNLIDIKRAHYTANLDVITLIRIYER